MATQTRRRAQEPAPAQFTMPDPGAIDARLAGWRWRTTSLSNGTTVHQLIGPDGWETPQYQKDTRAVSAALRRVRSLPAPALTEDDALTVADGVGLPPVPAEGWATPWSNDTLGVYPNARAQVEAERAAVAELAPETDPHGYHEVPPSDIRRDGGTQARVGNSEEVVEEYTAAMREGRWRWHPGNWLVAFRDEAGDLWLSDGFHRTEAALRADLTSVPVDVRKGGRREAVLFAVGANADHGHRRTREDVRRAIRTLLLDEEWRAWSNAKIATQARTTDKTVAAVRGELETTSEIPRLATRIGADGRERPATQPAPPRPAELSPDEIAALLRSCLARLDPHGAQPLLYGLPAGKVRGQWMHDMDRVRDLAAARRHQLGRAAQAGIVAQIGDVALREDLAAQLPPEEAAVIGSTVAPALPVDADDEVDDLIAACEAIEARGASPADHAELARISARADELGALTLGAWASDLAASVPAPEPITAKPEHPPEWRMLTYPAFVRWRDRAAALGCTLAYDQEAQTLTLPGGEVVSAQDHGGADLVARIVAMEAAGKAESRKQKAETDAAAVADPAPFDYLAWSRRAAAVGYNLPLRQYNYELVPRDHTRGQTYAIGEESQIIAAIEALEAAAAAAAALVPMERVAEKTYAPRATEVWDETQDGEAEDDDGMCVWVRGDGLDPVVAAAIAHIADSLRLLALGQAHAVDTVLLDDLAERFNHVETHARGTIHAVLAKIAADAEALAAERGRR